MGTDRVMVERIVVRPPSGEDEEALLEAIDAGAPVASALTLLLGRCALAGEAPLGARAGDLTVGQREALALRLRATALSSPMRAMMSCPDCREVLELALDPVALADAAGVPAGEAVLEADGYRLTCRPVRGADQEEAAAALPDAEPARLLLSRCVRATDADGQPIPVAALPDEVAERAAAMLLDLDPGAETTLAATCPACGAAVSGALDAGAFVLSELARRAAALPAEVLAIARATGWREAEILAMPPARRRRYARLLAPESLV